MALTVFPPGRSKAGESVTGFDFLRLDLGARPAAMGGSFVSVEGDVHSLRYNPAGLSRVMDKSLALTVQTLTQDIRYGFAGFVTALGPGKLGVGLFYLNYGSIQRTDIFGNEDGTFSPGDFVLNLAYSDSLGKGWRWGVGVKVIQSVIDDYSALGAAADAGVLYTFPNRPLSIGFSILNAGHGIQAFVNQKEKMPVTYQLGVSQRLEHLPLLISLNIIKYHYESSDWPLGLYWALGGEFTLSSHFFLRWGYNARGREQHIQAANDWMTGFSTGFGVLFSRYRIDYSYGSQGGLGQQNTMTFSIEL